MTSTSADLREMLMAEIRHVQNGGSTQPGGVERSRLVAQLSAQVIDSARVEVQLAAILKAQLTVPFIEGQAQERPARQDPEGLPAPQTPAERLDKMLHSGPAPDHPWREPNKGKAK